MDTMPRPRPPDGPTSPRQLDGTKEKLLRADIGNGWQQANHGCNAYSHQGRIKRREKTPAQAQHFLDTMRGLFRWAIEADKVNVFIIGAHNKPMAKKTFSHAFARAALKAGIRGKSAHGLRKLGATRAANAGATTAQLKSIFGWTSDRMPELYTRTADRRRLAMESMSKLANEKPTSIVAPSRIGATVKTKK